MSLTSESIDPWRTAALLTAYNAAFDDAGLDQLDDAFGIQRTPAHLADEAVTQLPAMAANVRARERYYYETRQDYGIKVTVRVSLAYATADPGDVLDVAGLYLDCIRSVAIAQLDGSWNLFRWVGDDPVGVPYDHTSPHLPSRIVTADFEFVVPYDGATV